MIVTFCGHRDVFDPEAVGAWLNETVEELIREGADCFYLGGYGQFDALAAATVRKQKSGIRRSAPYWCCRILTGLSTPPLTMKRSIRRWKTCRSATLFHVETHT